MSNPAYFIALPMSVNLRKRYLFYLHMLVIFKIVMQIAMPKSDTLFILLEKIFFVVYDSLM